MAREKTGTPASAADRGVYGITVAADLAGTGVQNLRLYERRGLLHPHRSDGGTRLYSANDVLRLQRIIDLLAAGLNLAGIAMVLDLQDDNNRMSTQHQIARPGTSKPKPKPSRPTRTERTRELRGSADGTPHDGQRPPTRP